MGVLDFLRRVKVQEKGQKIVLFNGGAYWLEAGPVRREITITTTFLVQNNMSFAEALRHFKIRSDYVPGGLDASVPPRRIFVDEPFRYTDYSKPDEFVWKFYKRVDGRLEHVADLGHFRDDAIEAAKQFIKKDT